MVNVPQGLQDLTVHVELNASAAGVDVDLELYDPGPDTFPGEPPRWSRERREDGGPVARQSLQV